MRCRRRQLALLAPALLAAACGNDVGMAPAIETIETVSLELEYPDIDALFDGEQGIYRGCAPNQGVCHNGRQYPDLRSVGVLLDHIGRPCNELREDPGDVHDWCETAGDSLLIGRQDVEIGYFEPTDESEQEWLLYLREEPPALDSASEVLIARRISDEWRPLYRFLNLRGQLTNVTDEMGEPAVRFTANDTIDLDGAATRVLDAFARAGIPGDPRVIQLGDPNANGVFGADLNGGLVVPGQPEGSYLMRRLVDPDFGTLMPLANCCFWTRESLRALWCWIAGLEPDASNAYEPIDYTSCPDGPIGNLEYPEPGPMCEGDGLCPVSAVDPLVEGPTWAGVSAIFRQSCAGTLCHVGGDGQSEFVVPFSDEGAYAAIRDRISISAPEDSVLLIRLDPDRCQEPDCDPMPLDRDPLPDEQVQLIRAWIEAGAPQ